MSSFRRGGWVVALLAITIVAHFASATVTQVDGEILPRPNGTNECDGAGGDNLQICFNTLEGVSPPNVNAIDQTLDAAQLPEIFLPNTAMPVTFRDISEGAGYENSFGWYNIGDDVVTAAGMTANLHPVLGCGRPMAATGNATTHAGNPAFYVQNAEPGSMATVDFAMERTANRYKGGFIGFYLITPEGNPSANDNACGDFKNGTDNLSLLGRIYYTQKDLNSDGDFVHHLVYRSKLVANRFYFGFEDLFRGGDNDFEDMLIQTVGLTPPCVPQAEVCDSIDNDCDGLVDGLDPDLTGTGNVCTCDDISLSCDNGPRFGQCQTGVTACTAGAITCHGTGVSSPEVCDGADNNCNNMVDDNPSGTGAACDGADSDACPEGTIQCTNGMLACNDSSGPNDEICNNFDDNCNGQTDEGNPGGGGSCGSAIGVCTPGTLACTGGSLMCLGGNAGGAELCNGVDDDCNGVVDNSPTDIGMTCGMTDVGECGFGTTICANGSVQCAGETGPQTELCNNLDDDCNGVIDNNPVDAGQPCGSSIGACNPGAFQCVMGGLTCTGGTGPSGEICNAIDDDCDGTVDEMVPGEGVACGSGMGPCTGGATKCINGTMECVGGTSGGTETCNAIDDDCDGMIDDGDLCNGGTCDNGSCASPCIPGEFPCPQGKKCEAGFCVADPCFGISCPASAEGDLQSCQDGVCAPLCPTITCPNGLVCRGVDGVCVPDTCEYLPKCAANEICIDKMCTSNPCAGVTCPGDQFCREGTCVASCQGIQCGGNTVCRDGTCVPTGCSMNCGDAYCNPMTGMCEEDPCQPVQCPPTQVCDPASASCVADPCQGVTCPGNQVCDFGQCGVGKAGELVTTGGGGGCNSSGGDGAIGLVLIVGALLLRRRRAAVLAVAIAAAAPACSVNEYCIACEVATGDGGVDDSGDGGGDGGDGGVPSCDPNQVRPETCNLADDDCDGAIDEAIDTQNDEMNCGACGVQCNKPGAQTTCQSGACTITGCFPGFNDRNGDLAGPYAASDGCEYMCFTSNAGIEACDALDNNCNGMTDETFDKVSDPMNCGACGRVCDFFQATGHCTLSTCTFNGAVDCATGYSDANGMQADGCEYQCTPSNGGVEACDVIDNDCDGRVDETFTLSSDPNNCGRCGLTCQFPHASASCAASMCTFNPATDCAAGFVDVNGVRIDGCEYQCTPTGMELCDGADNDCDGTADDNVINAGGSCASTSPPRGVCIANGTTVCAAGMLICSGATEATAETCDALDNDCDGAPDDGISQSCYTGAMGTSGIGVCRPGSSTCAGGTFGGCVGQVLPMNEICNNLDDDCNSVIDNGPNGMPISQTCYGGPMGTAGIGTCRSGTQTCAFGAFGTCAGEVRPRADVCGDNLDSDCDALNDTQEGCLALEAEQRLEAPGGTLGEAMLGAAHSFDVVLARGSGGNVYAAWSERVSTTEVYFRKSTDGGLTWGTIINVTAAVNENAVKPVLAVAPGTTDRVVVAYQTFTSSVRDIRVSASTDGGATFGTATARLDTAGDSFHHSVAISGTTVVVAWEKLDTGTLIRDVMSATSTNGGTTFTAEIKVNVGSPATRFAGRPQVAITSTGRVIWAWREQRGTRQTRDLFAASAATATTAPATDTRIDNDTADNRDSDFPVLAVAEQSAYLVWQDVSTVASGGSDVIYTRSLDGGATWGAEVIIDDPATEVSSSFTPTLAVDPRAAGAADDLVAIAWEDRRQGTQIFASTSVDGGTTFAAPIRASSDAGGVIAGQTSLPMIAAAGGGVLSVAYQNQLTNDRVHVFVASSIDSGATWTFTHARLDGGSGSAVLPVIVGATVGAEPGTMTAWTDFRTAPGVNGDIYTAVSH
ncbi:MAG: Myxococcales trans domain protein [Myxococcales bacterium]|nr:Myxococcales trans domain protein [Myxococcales bacterium]